MVPKINFYFLSARNITPLFDGRDVITKKVNKVGS